MDDVKYRSEVRIEQREGLDREAFLPPWAAGGHVRGPRSRGAPLRRWTRRPHAIRRRSTTVVGATAGRPLGTLGVVLGMRARIDATGDRLTAVAVGEVEDDDGVLVIKRIHVRYRLAVSQEQRATAERLHGVHALHCPAARSIASSIAVSTELETVAPQIEIVPATT